MMGFLACVRLLLCGFRLSQRPMCRFDLFVHEHALGGLVLVVDGGCQNWRHGALQRWLDLSELALLRLTLAVFNHLLFVYC